MIIDLILDRKDNEQAYNPKSFYNSVMNYYNAFPEIVEPIANALDSGEEEDVKRVLRNYIKAQGYNLEICSYINSQEWI